LVSHDVSVKVLMRFLPHCSKIANGLLLRTLSDFAPRPAQPAQSPREAQL
jgi:hypothetical protein